MKSEYTKKIHTPFMAEIKPNMKICTQPLDAKFYGESNGVKNNSF